MILQNLYLANFCQHRDRTFEFSPRLNLIVGPNGSGKTNMLRGMQLALTGVAGGAGQKIDDITQHVRDTSRVVLRLSHNGDDVRIERGLRPVTNALYINDQLTCRTVAEIAEELYARLGTTKQQINDYIFVKQRGIDAWLDKRDAERAKELGELFHLDQAESIWHALGQYVTATEMPLSIDVTTYEQEYTKACQAVAGVNGQLAQYGDVPTDIAAFVEQQLTTICTYDQRIDFVRRIEYCNADIKTTEQKIEQQQAELESIRTNLDLVRVTKQSLMSIEAIRNCRTAWVTYQAERRLATLVVKCEQSLRAAVAAVPERPELLPDGDFNDLIEREDKLRRELLVLQVKKAELESTQVGQPCPTCGKPLDDPTVKVAELSLRIRRNVPYYNRVKRQFEQQHELRSQQQAYVAAIATVSRVETELSDVQSQVTQVEQPTVTLEVLTHNETTYGELEQGERLFVRDLDVLRTQFEADSQHISTMHQQIVELEAALAELPLIEQGTAQRARLSIDCMKERAVTRDALASELAVGQVQIRATETQLTAVRASNDLRGRRLAAVSYLEQLRGIFHRNELPRMVSYTYLERMQESINATLELFEAPFFVTTSEDLGFNAHFGDGRQVADRRLSVGERIVLAMAFRVAVNTTFAASLGVLIMDEPTAGLDEHNLGCLPRALEQLRSLSESCGLQVLFVTHEPRISYLFDRVIDLANVS